MTSPSTLGPRATILIVDDEPHNRKLLEALLRPEGYVTASAADGEEALTLIAELPPDLILLDIMMPGMDGYQVASAIKANPATSNIPIIMVTAQLDHSARLAGLNAGAEEFLTKPIDRAELWLRVRNLLRLKEYGDLLRDHRLILERRVAERTAELESANGSLRESEDRYRDLVENSRDLICTHDLEGNLLSINPEAVRLIGYSLDATRRINMADMLTQGARAGFADYLAEIRTKGAARGLMHIRTANGKTRVWEYDNTLRTQGVAAPVVRGMAQDVTERMTAQDALQRSEVQLRGILESTADGILAVDSKGKVIRANRRFAELWRIPSSLLDTGDDQALLDFVLKQLNDPEAFVKKVRTLYASDAEDMDVLTFKDGRTFERQSSPLILDGAVLGRVWSFRDITEYKRRESDLLRFRLAMDATVDAIYLVDRASMRFLDINAAASRMLSQTREEILAQGPEGVLSTPRAELERIYDSVIAGGAATEPVTMLRPRKDGTHAWVELRRSAQRSAEGWTIITVARDINERKVSEEALRAAEEQFRGLIEQSIAGIYIIQDGKYAYVNPRFAEIRGYGSADEMIGLDPIPLIVETDRSAVVEHLRRLDEGETRSVAFDFGALRRDGVTIQLGVNIARATHKGRPALIGMLQDISDKKRAEEEIRRYVEQLQTAFMSTVEVATTLSEMRDPYTAGHERRVAKIAVAIGAELGFDARRQEGLQVAGQLHDIGKITIPSEILSKPGKLSQTEFQLIKEHAQASYDVLKGVEFPWPVAEVALQHHERMDGSGYPQGLKGEAILLEARIMAVADVIEAMSSHRPYRPGLGIDKALAEIERGRGSAYDPLVADACLRLFRQNGYQVPA